MIIYYMILIGNLNQPKWGHLKELHDVLHSMEDTLTRGNISSVDFGNSVSVCIIISLLSRI
jgi:hypothetical protein